MCSAPPCGVAHPNKNLEREAGLMKPFLNSGAMKDKGQVFISVCNTKPSDFYLKVTQE